VDLRADRRTSTLHVQGSFAEPDAPADTAAELAEELGQLAAWLALEAVVVQPRGDLAAALVREVAARLPDRVPRRPTPSR